MIIKFNATPETPPGWMLGWCNKQKTRIRNYWKCSSENGWKARGLQTENTIPACEGSKGHSTCTTSQIVQWWSALVLAAYAAEKVKHLSIATTTKCPQMSYALRLQPVWSWAFCNQDLAAQHTVVGCSQHYTHHLSTGNPALIHVNVPPVTFVTSWKPSTWTPFSHIQTPTPASLPCKNIAAPSLHMYFLCPYHTTVLIQLGYGGFYESNQEICCWDLPLFQSQTSQRWRWMAKLLNHDHHLQGRIKNTSQGM